MLFINCYDMHICTYSSTVQWSTLFSPVIPVIIVINVYNPIGKAGVLLEII